MTQIEQSREARTRDALRIKMLTRRLALGRNPLRRTSDRLESLVMLAAMTLGLLLVPIAATLGETTHSSVARTSMRQEASVHRVTVRTTEAAPDALTDSPIAPHPRVRATWRDDAGITHAVRISVPSGQRSGSEFQAWVGRHGLAAAPASPIDNAILGVTVGLGVLGTGWCVLLATVLLVRSGLDRGRLRSWEREWAAASPD